MVMEAANGSLQPSLHLACLCERGSLGRKSIGAIFTLHHTPTVHLLVPHHMLAKMASIAGLYSKPGPLLLASVLHMLCHLPVHRFGPAASLIAVSLFLTQSRPVFVLFDLILPLLCASF